jgi:ribosomal protein RSM22 (predicted rRNA methylase)
MIAFQLPAADELQKAGKDGRMNIFRQYFASSRYNRLLIQQTLVRSSRDSSLVPQVASMERSHNSDFAQTVSRVKKYGYFGEFLDAVAEEDNALQKIIEAYDKRMHSA